MDSKVIGVLGGGQLGRMLLQAGSPLAIPIVVLDPDTKSPAKQVSSPAHFQVPGLSHLDGKFTDEASIRELARQVDVLTVEIEHVDVAAVERVSAEFPKLKVYPAPDVIRTIQDKYLQKVHLAAHGVALTPFRAVDATPAAVRDAVAAYGLPLMLKSRLLAYDGRGNFLLRDDSDASIAAALAALAPAGAAPSLYAEQFSPFIKEVAVMVVRSESGSVQAFPAVETIHRDNICHIVYAPLRPTVAADHGTGRAQDGRHALTGIDVAARAQALATRAVAALGAGAVGVFGVEMFLLADGSLLLNEIAPRPHNSGHYTIEACAPSQYLAHLYAVLGLALPPITFIPAAAAMLNLLGASDDARADFAAVTAHAISLGAAVHLYGKAGCRPGRKMGHITVVGRSDADVHAKIDELVARLPPPYAVPVPTANYAPRAPFSNPRPLVSVVMGSDSDLPVMRLAAQILDDFEVPYELSIVSAHRTPARMVEFARTAASRGVRTIIAGAGGAAHLPGMIASETSLPVIGVPVKGSTLDGVDSLYSIVQMPRGIPVATVAINNATNAALLAIRILGTSIPELQTKIENYSIELEDGVKAKLETLETVGWKDYVVKK